MTDLQMWDLIWGFIGANFLLPIVQQPKWSTPVRAGVTFGFCLISGVVIAKLNGAFHDVHDLRSGMSSVILLLIATIGAYQGFGKPTGIAPAIERFTSRTPGPYPD